MTMRIFAENHRGFGLALLLTAILSQAALFPRSAACAAGFPMDFCLFRLGHGSPTALLFGGIQGDEPGGFSAATLLATRYEINRGSIWVVPNLNFPSIIKRSRGLHGDMNRKFARLDETDPEFSTVRRTQELILDPQIGLVLNLHDGSGWYRPKYKDKLFNPSRWGQSVIIDQEALADGIFMNDLSTQADNVANEVNTSLIRPHHAIHVHNTKTALGDHEMEKSLSWFAARNGKAAFGIEASKELPVNIRAYYHLRMVEAFLKQAGIEFSRDFELTPEGVEKALRENLGVSFAENRVFLPLENTRGTISHLPLPRDGAGLAITSKPIMAVLPCEGKNDRICIHYGNRTIALIHPDWREMDDSLDAMPVHVDGRDDIAPFGQVLDVSESVRVGKLPGYRVNLIGHDSGKADESGKTVRLADFDRHYSVDRNGLLYRAEIYRGKKFSGMFLLRFARRTGAASVAGRNSGK